MLLQATQAQLVATTEVSAWSGPRIAFLFIAALTVGGAILTITRRNPIGAVMSLVATFFGIAATYALLYAHFLAALQVLVYAGAIMVLFIFVVMVLNRDEIEPVSFRGIFAKLVGLAAVVYLVSKVVYPHLLNVVVTRNTPPPRNFGTVEEVGMILFTDYLFVFEAVSILLLIAVIAAVVVARVHKHAPEPQVTPEEAHEAGGHH